MSRAFNFSAGPAALPESVLVQVRDELLEWKGERASVMEVSHRGQAFIDCAAEAERDLRELMGVPEDYAVLFLQGGASLQFSMVPMNLLSAQASADYIVTGAWSQKAVKEAKRVGGVKIAASTEGENFARIPRQEELKLDPNAAYVHYTTNNTIFGTEFHYIPDVGSVPLVADTSSDMFSGPMDVSKFGLIYAGAQKNLAPAGLTLVIVRDDLLKRTPSSLPTMLQYGVHVENKSMYNTPPTYAVYIAGLVFEWLLAQGGVKAIEKKNIAKAALLYDYLDTTEFYRAPARKIDRSRMNVRFHLHDESLDSEFLVGAKAAGMDQLKGHRAVGGMRASIYNAMPREGVEALVAFMEEFRRRHA